MVVPEEYTTTDRRGNVTQYCKKEDCWRSFINVELPLPAGFRQTQTRSEGQDSTTPPVIVLDDNPAVATVQSIAPDAWFRLGEWANKNKALGALDLKIVSDIALNIGYGKPISSRQLKDGVRIIEVAKKNGFKF